MPKAMYIGGTDGKARKVTAAYIGGTDGKARKIVRMYIGDTDGKARLFYSAAAENALVLYDNGQKPYAYTLAQYTSGPTITSSHEDKSTYVRLYASGKTTGWGTGNPAGAIMLLQNIDITGYTRLCVEAELKTLTVYDNSAFNVCVGDTVNSFGYINQLAKTDVKTSSTTSRQTVTVDISGLSGVKHIAVRANVASPDATSTVDAYIYKIYLEP